MRTLRLSESDKAELSRRGIRVRDSQKPRNVPHIGVNIDKAHKLLAASFPLGPVQITSRTLTLPFPPSANAYWRHVNGKTLLAKSAREYRQRVAAAVMAAGHVKQMDGELACVITYVYPDKRRRDLDNLVKQVLDAMQHAGVYRDDSQIVDLHLMKMPDRGLPAQCEVRLHARQSQ